MKRSEFMEKIDNAISLIEPHYLHSCDALNISFNSKYNSYNTVICKLYSRTFKMDSNLAWFGNQDYFKNQCTRVNALLLFKEYTLSEKLYKELS